MPNGLLWIGVGCIFLYELLTLIDRRAGNTISERIWAVSAKRPLVPFAFGLLAGHLFWGH